MFRRIAVLVSATAGVAAVVALFVLFGSGTQLTSLKSRKESPKRDP